MFYIQDSSIYFNGLVIDDKIFFLDVPTRMFVFVSLSNEDDKSCKYVTTPSYM